MKLEIRCIFPGRFMNRFNFLNDETLGERNNCARYRASRLIALIHSLCCFRRISTRHSTWQQQAVTKRWYSSFSSILTQTSTWGTRWGAGHSPSFLFLYLVSWAPDFYGKTKPNRWTTISYCSFLAITTNVIMLTRGNNLCICLESTYSRKSQIARRVRISVMIANTNGACLIARLRATFCRRKFQAMACCWAFTRLSGDNHRPGGEFVVHLFRCAWGEKCWSYSGDCSRNTTYVLIFRDTIMNLLFRENISAFALILRSDLETI